MKERWGKREMEGEEEEGEKGEVMMGSIQTGCGERAG